MNDKITVCLGKGGQREMAESFSQKEQCSDYGQTGRTSDSNV